MYPKGTLDNTYICMGVWQVVWGLNILPFPAGCVVLEFYNILLEPFWEILVLQLGIYPRFNCNAFKETLPEPLVFQFFLGKAVQHFLLEFLSAG